MKLTSLVWIAIVPAAMALTACGNKGGSQSGDGGNTGFEIEKGQSAAGLVGGAPWVFQSGVAKVSPFDDSSLSITLWEEQVANPCEAFHVPERVVMFSVPAEIMAHTLGNMRNFTFYTQANQKNLIVTEGALEISSITETEVEGGLVGQFDSENLVNGTFRVPLCP